MIAKCYLCGGKTERKLITAENWRGDKLVLVENVPAWVCENCGEAYPDGEVCMELDRMWDSPPPLDRKMEVPPYSYPEDRAPAAERTSRAERPREAAAHAKRATLRG